jgi:formate dehydrogenase major subunit
MINYVPTICPYCGIGCGIYLVVKDGKIVGVEPWKEHPINEGKVCIKGNCVYEFVNREDRLKKPLIKENGKFREAEWDEVIKIIAERFKNYGPDEIGVLSSAKCTNEENYLMQKFARAVLKSPHIDNCARLCHSSTVVGLARTFGAGAMTNSIPDIEESKCIFIIGSNTFEQHPLIARRVIHAKEKGARVIVADPRYTTTAKQADLYLQFYSGTDVALMNGMMQVIIKKGLEDKEFIESRTRDFDKLKEEVMKDKYSLENISSITGVPTEDIEKATVWISESEATTLIYSVGITQHIVGTDNVITTANLQMLAGNVGRAGAGVNPLRGQNNVQGACDMGALSNVYSGYQKVTDEAKHKRMEEVWGTDIAEGGVGLTVTEMMNALEGKEEGDLKALYIMGENPMLSDPDIKEVEKGLKKLDFLVVQDIFLTETAELADVVLPASCWAEKDGTFTNTSRRVQRVRKAVDPPGEAREDWRIICQIAEAMGYSKQFSYESAEAIFDEIAKVTSQYGGMNYERLESVEGLQWPCPTVDHPGTKWLYSEKFSTDDGLGHFNATEYKPPAEVPDSEYPLILTTGRLYFHWHTGTMTRRSKTLDAEVPTGYVEINEEDAKESGIENGESVNVTTRRGTVRTKAKVTPDIKKGEIFMPFHFKECAANVLTNNALDPVAKIPEYKACAAKIEKGVLK